MKLTVKLVELIKDINPFNNKDNIYSITDQALVSIGNFLTSVLLARFLDLHNFGIYGIYLIVTMFFLSLQLSLIASPLYTFLQRIDEPAARKNYTTDVFYLNLLVILVFSFLTHLFLSFLDFFSDHLQTSHIASCATLAVFARLLQEYSRRHFFAHRQILQAVKLDLLVFILQILVIGLTGKLFGLTLAGAFYILCATYLVGFGYALLISRPGPLQISNIKKLWHRYWKFAKWLVGGAVLSAVIRDYIIFHVGIVLSPVEVGKLCAAQRLGGLIGVIMQLMENVVPVKAAAAFHRRGAAGLQAFIRKIYVHIAILSVIILIFIGLFSEQLMVRIFGAQYSGTSLLLLGFAVSTLINIIINPLHVRLRTIEKTSPIFWGILFGAIINVSLANILITHLGLNGAVLTLIMSNLTVLCWLVYCSVKINKTG